MIFKDALAAAYVSCGHLAKVASAAVPPDYRAAFPPKAMRLLNLSIFLTFGMTILETKDLILLHTLLR